MSCDEISELLPAYVLGALDADELQAVEAHLREGREHDEELVELRATVFALDRFGEDLAPDATPESISPPAERSHGLSRIGRPPVWLAAIAAAVVLAVFGAGWLIGDLVDGSGREVSIEVGVQRAGGRSGPASKGPIVEKRNSIGPLGSFHYPGRKTRLYWAVLATD